MAATAPTPNPWKQTGSFDTTQYANNNSPLVHFPSSMQLPDTAAGFTEFVAHIFEEVIGGILEFWKDALEALFGITIDAELDILAMIAYFWGVVIEFWVDLDITIVRDLVALFTGGLFGDIEDLLGLGGWANMTEAWQNLTSWIWGDNKKPGLTSQIPSSQISKDATSLQLLWDFPTALSMGSGGNGWEFDPYTDHTGVAGSGSAKYLCNGTQGALDGTITPVQPRQIISPTGYAVWTGLNAGTGTSPIQLWLVPYSGTVMPLTGALSDLVAGAPIYIDELTSVASTSAAYPTEWSELTGNYDVPNDGSVVAVRMRLVVSADSTTGSVNWDDCADPVTQGGFIDDWLYSLFGSRDRPTTTTQVLPASIGDITIGNTTASIETHMSSIVDFIVQGVLGGKGTGNDPGQIIQALQAVPQGNIAVTNAAALTTVSVVGSGAGANNNAAIPISGKQPITWTDTIPANADYVAVVVHCANTNGSGSTCSIISPDTIELSPLASIPYGDGSPIVTIYGLANPPTGSVEFQAEGNETASVVTLISATSISLAGVGSVQDIAFESDAQDANPSLVTSYTSPALVLNAIGTFGTGGTTATLSGYSGGSLEYQSGSVAHSPFMTDMIVGTKSSPSDPTFAATASTLNTSEFFGAVAIAFNPSSDTPVIGSGFRQYRTLTAGVSAVSGYNPFGTFFDTNDFNTEDCSFDAATGVLTIGYAGHYAVTLHVLENNTTISHLVRPILYKNGSIERNGHTLPITNNASDTYIFGDTWSLYLNSEDTLEPGYWASRNVSSVLTGESTGTKSFWEVSLINRSLM